MVMLRFLREQSGAAMVEMTIVVMLLFTLVLGFVDFGYAFYQWNAANKAVQVGARLAAVSDPVTVGITEETASPPEGKAPGDPVDNDGTTYHYVCTNAGCECATGRTCMGEEEAFDLANFTLIYAGDDGLCQDTVAPGRPGMCDFFPALQEDEVQIEYVATGLGYWTRPGGPVPTIRVSIINRTFDFFFLSGLLSFTPITMPDMLSTITGEDLSTTY
jgi:Flp pilus assembly protein TadG